MVPSQKKGKLQILATEKLVGGKSLIYLSVESLYKNLLWGSCAGVCKETIRCRWSFKVDEHESVEKAGLMLSCSLCNSTPQGWDLPAKKIRPQRILDGWNKYPIKLFVDVKDLVLVTFLWKKTSVYFKWLREKKRNPKPQVQFLLCFLGWQARKFH